MQEIIKIDAMIPLHLVFCGSVEAILFIYSALHILCSCPFSFGTQKQCVLFQGYNIECVVIQNGVGKHGIAFCEHEFGIFYVPILISQTFRLCCYSSCVSVFTQCETGCRRVAY